MPAIRRAPPALATAGRRRSSRRLLALVAASCLAAPWAPAAGQFDTPRARVPVPVGERLTYDVKFGPLQVGRASMEVIGVEDVRGRAAWHTRFRVTGGTPFFHVNDVLESWIDTATFSSLRFHEELSEGNHDRLYDYEIHPERGTYIRAGKPEAPSVRQPLDDASFLYFLRTIPLEVGATYEFPRYFIPDRNPVRLDVLRHDRVTVPAGTFQTLLVRPVIKTKGVFAENGRAQVWVTDDSEHVLVQMTSELKFGSLSLHLRSRQLAAGSRGRGRSHGRLALVLR